MSSNVEEFKVLNSSLGENEDWIKKFKRELNSISHVLRVGAVC